VIEIVNNQRKIKIRAGNFQEYAQKVVETIFAADGKTVTIAFVSDKKMRELNKTFRGKNSTTDVLSFPFEADEFEKLSDSSALADEYFREDNLGDIIISIEQAERQAIENNLDFETEIKQLILHGVLHLCGYDHEQDAGEMNELELQVRDKLGVK
jgi:probable rRNA maturation factor